MSHNNFSDLVNCLRSRSQNQPSQRAFTFLVDGELEEVNLSYGELDLQARAIAAQLQALVPSGSRVLLCYPSGLEFISAFFGCLCAGMISVPVAIPKRSQMQSRLQAIINDSQPAAVMTTEALLDSLKQSWLSLPELPVVQWIKSDRLSPDLAPQWQQPSLKPDSLAFLQYTSGSTGHPKGVMVSHRNLLQNSAYIQTAFELEQSSVSVSWLPNFHDMGLIDSIIQPIYTGYLGVLMSPTAFLQKPMRWLAAISRYQATHCGGPNQGYELCVRKISSEQISQAQIDLSCWQSAYTGAEPIRKSTLEQFANKFQPLGFQSKFFYPCYGMAESTLMISGGLVNAEPVYCAIAAAALEQKQVVTVPELELNAKHFVSVGKTWLDTKIAIANPETHRECPPDQVGEIWVSGSSVALGYWQQPEITKATFQAQLIGSQSNDQVNWLRTGDLGFVRDGELFVTGRLKDLLILWGRNHYPQDIELTVQNSYPALRIDAGAAFAIETDCQEYLVIVQEVERTALRELDVEAIVAAIRQAVTEQHEISVFAIALIKPASIPKTSSGKIQRQTCRDQFLADSLDIVGQWTQPQLDPNSLTMLETSDSVSILTEGNNLTKEAIADWIVTRLSQVANLDPDEIDIDEPLSLYGLDSSVLLSLTADLSDWLGEKLMPTLFWEYPTITSLATYLIKLK